MSDKQCVEHHNACDCREGQFARLTQYADDLEKRIAEVEAENKLLQDEMDARNMASSKALDELWKEIILTRKPAYGDWDYPMQAKRHIVCEFNELQAELEKAKFASKRDRNLAELARGLCDDYKAELEKCKQGLKVDKVICEDSIMKIEKVFNTPQGARIYVHK